MVASAPAEMEIPRESITRLLKAAYYLLDVKPVVISDMSDPSFIKAAIEELEKALGPLGLGIDYWDKIHAWRQRDVAETGRNDFLVLD